MTVYKAQGQTLPAVIYDPGEAENKLGSTIVATSRTPTAEGLFIKYQNRERWNKITEHPDMKIKYEESKRYRQLFNRTKKKYKKIFQAWCANQRINIKNYPTHIQNWLNE